MTDIGEEQSCEKENIRIHSPATKSSIIGLINLEPFLKSPKFILFSNPNLSFNLNDHSFDESWTDNSTVISFSASHSRQPITPMEVVNNTVLKSEQ